MAASDYISLVEQIYVGFYGRPADAEGLEYWAEQLDEKSGNLDAILSSFATSDEAENFVFTDPEGNSLGNDQLIENIYQNLFSHAPDAEGKAYYLAALEDGSMTLETIVKNVADGAQNEDQTALANKVSVAKDFTANLDGADYGSDDILDARGLLAAVDATPETVDAANTAAADLIAGMGDVTPEPTLTATAANAAYALYSLPADASATDIAVATALKLTTADAAIAAGATQAEIDAAFDVLVSDGAAALTLANVLGLDSATTAVADYLSAVDTDVVDPTTVNDDEDGKPATDDTVASANDVHADYAAAVTAYNSAVTGADVVNDSAATATALYDAELASLKSALTVAEAAVTDAKAAIAEVDGLDAAITAFEAATVANTAAGKATATAHAAKTGALASFDDLNDTVVATTVLADADRTNDIVTEDGTTVIEYDATAKAYIISEDSSTGKPYTEADYEGITELLDAINAEMVAVDAAAATAKDLAEANAAVAQLDPDATAMANATAGLKLTTAAASVATIDEVNAETDALAKALATADTALSDLAYWDTDAGTTATALDNAVAALKTDLESVSATGKTDAEVNAAVEALTTAAVTAETLSAADKIVIDSAFAGADADAADGDTTDDFEDSNLAAAITAAKAAVDANNQVNEFDALVKVASDADTAVNDFAVLTDAIDAGSSALAGALDTAEDAVFDDKGTADTKDDTGAKVAITDLEAAKAEYEALAVIEKDLTALEETADKAAKAVDEVMLDNGSDNFGTDTVGFITKLDAGDTSVVTDFNVDTDCIYFGDDYTVNTGALTTGDNAVVEMFVTELSATDDTAVITFETSAFGSASEADFFTVQLTGVAADEIAVVNGMIVGA